MKSISLLPADRYTLINKSIITEEDKNNIITLYEPIIGPIAVSLYFTFLRDLHRLEYMSVDYNHHHLMSIMKSSIDIIKTARESLEAVGLIKTYFKEGEVNSYVYEIFSPLSSKEFFASPIFNVVLYNNLGKNEYKMIAEEYKIPKFDLKEYEDISKSLNMIYKSSPNLELIETKEHNSQGIRLESNIDFDLILSSMPKGLLKSNALSKKMKDLINNLSFIYNLDTLKMIELLRISINEKGTFDTETLRKSASKYYQYNNSGRLPTLIYRTQPEYLKTPQGDNSPMAKLIYMFENTTPYDFLKMKYKGGTPTASDLKLLEYLMNEQKLSSGVVNILIDYVLKKNNNKLVKAYVEAIAAQWKRSGVETVQEAIELARKENKKNTKKTTTNKEIKNKSLEPVWMNKQIEKEEMNEEDLKELEDMFKEYR